MTASTSTPTDALDEESLSQRVYAELRRRIIRGDFPPGARLRERELAEEFQVSRIPLREALPQLEADGFIKTLPRRGAVVTQLTMHDVEELFDVRLGVEVWATRLAARRAARGVPTEPVRLAMERSEAAVRSGDPEAISTLNAELHAAIIDFSGNQLLISMMAAVEGRHLWIFQLTGGRNASTTCDEHHQLCDAIHAGDEELASALAYAHIERGRAPSVAALRGRLPERA